MTHNQKLGKLGEEMASYILKKKGYEILYRNWRCSHGELDIIGSKGEQLVFFEVKTRRSTQYGWPEEAITQKKQEHLQNCIHAFLDANPVFEGLSWQIDVIAILIKSIEQEQFEIVHYENAVDEI